MTVAELESGLRWLMQQTYNEEEFNRRKRHYIDLLKLRNMPNGVQHN
ncbi:MAG: hypothetical protein HQL45_17655, partial [Alphaproteobacteria bacterium]|nr:hypothetical protein [Alphaproteobacteria bacterium]